MESRDWSSDVCSSDLAGYLFASSIFFAIPTDSGLHQKPLPGLPCIRIANENKRLFVSCRCREKKCTGCGCWHRCGLNARVTYDNALSLSHTHLIRPTPSPDVLFPFAFCAASLPILPNYRKCQCVQMLLLLSLSVCIVKGLNVALIVIVVVFDVILFFVLQHFV